MAREFQLPEVSEGVTDAEVSEIMVAEGDVIEAGQTVMEVETEKAAAPVECPFAGTVAKIHVAEGDSVPIGAVLLTIEDGDAPAAKDDGGSAEKPAEPAKSASPAAAASNGEPADEGSYDCDLLVLGGGPGGYPAAFEAADHGLNVVLVDDNDAQGGVCLRVGCIPSKTLLHVSKLLHEAEEAAAWGVHFEKPTIDLAKLREFKSGVVGRLTGGIGQLGKARGVETVKGRGTFVDSHTVAVEVKEGGSRNITFKHAIVAVGSVPAMPKVFDIGDDRVMDSSGALELKDVPKRLLVVGGGYIGLEMGSVYAALGSEVTVVEATPHLLPGADRDLVKPLQKKLEKDFDRILTDTRVGDLEATEAGIVATLLGNKVGGEAHETFDRVLIAIGRKPNGHGVGLENTHAVIDDRGYVEHDAMMRTADPALLVIGDVAGEPMLAHKATREAKIAVETLLGHETPFDNVGIPAVVFTDPEVAWVGLTEQEAKEEGREVKVARFPWAASGRAVTVDRPEGLTKLVTDPETGRVLGVGIVGVNAGELIAEGTLAVEMAAVAEDVAETIHAHPTLSETVMESGELIGGQATHYVSRR